MIHVTKISQIILLWNKMATRANFSKMPNNALYKVYTNYSKTYVKRPLSKRTKIGFQDQLSLNAGQKYSRMLQGEHSAILFTFINLHWSLRSLFCLFLSSRFTQVLLILNQGSKFKIVSHQNCTNYSALEQNGHQS